MPDQERSPDVGPPGPGPEPLIDLGPVVAPCAFCLGTGAVPVLDPDTMQPSGEQPCADCGRAGTITT